MSVAVLQQLLKPPGETNEDAHLEAALWAALPAGCQSAWQVHAQRAGSQVGSHRPLYLFSPQFNRIIQGIM